MSSVLNPRNQAVADALREVAELLGLQAANPFRVAAYLRASTEIATLARDVAEILDREGVAGLEALPHVGHGIAGAVQELCLTGRFSLLERLRGSVDAEALFQTIPGVGPELARRLHDALHVESLQALEAAAYSDQLDAVPGIGPRRRAALLANLNSMLSRRGKLRRGSQAEPAVAVAAILAVDREYRKRACAGDLPTITPRRFNPNGDVRLPILHTERDGWHFTALYSNGALAHELRRTRDWVLIFCYDDQHQEVQHTVVTERRGALIGQRVVRGREAECLGHYVLQGV